MNKYSLGSHYMVEVNEREIQFYTQTKHRGVTNTTLWKYELSSRELHRCFEISGRMAIWKYSADAEVKYLGVSSVGKFCVIGLSECGDTLFRYVLEGTPNYPEYDSEGNIYIASSNMRMLCLNKKGELLWKWKPICSYFCGLNPIKKYWVANDKLYVIAQDDLYALSLDGNTEVCHKIADFNEATRYEIQTDRIIFSSENYQELICYNFEGENLWRYSVDRDEMIFEIATIKDELSCLRVKNRADESTKLCVLDNTGKKLWDVTQEWWQLLTPGDEQIALINDKKIVIYDGKGCELLRYSYKSHIVWGGFIANRLLMLVERKGNISLVECNSDLDTLSIVEMEIKEQTEEAYSSKKISYWHKELTEYLLLNMELVTKYIKNGIQEIVLSYERYHSIQIQVLDDMNIWLDGSASSIPYEERDESDRDSFKECSCRDDIVWIEFCDDCPETYIPIVMGMVCNSLSGKLGVSVRSQ